MIGGFFDDVSCPLFFHIFLALAKGNLIVTYFCSFTLGLCLPERQGLLFGHVRDRARSVLSGLIFSTSAILRACTVMGHGIGWSFALNYVVPCAFLR